jgi:beta-glucosidase
MLFISAPLPFCFFFCFQCDFDRLDSVHGANYVDGAILFPQQIGLAATFNKTKAYETGRITAKDTRAAGIPWVFTPILDIAVHKLWPRVYETYGEGNNKTRRP